MIKKHTLFIALSVLSFSIYGQKISELDFSSFVEARGIPTIPNLNVIPTSGVDFYMDATSFEGACTAEENLSVTLVDAGLQNTLVGPFGLGICSTQVSSTTNNECYTTGALEPGFTLSATVGDLLVIGSGLFNPVDPAFIGPDLFESDMRIDFQQATNLGCFDFAELLLPVGNAVTVEIFGASGSLGVLNTIDNGLNPITICFAASENITSITISDVGSAGLLSSLSFGLCESTEVTVIPTMGEWGLMSLGLLLLIIGIVEVKQKQAAIQA